MRKNRIIFSLICISLTVCSCSGEKNHLKDARELKTTISFDQLQDIAIEPVNQDKNYNLKATSLAANYEQFAKVNCSGSTMYTCYDTSISDYKLFAVNGSKSISYRLKSGILNSNNNMTSTTDVAISNYNFPIAVIEEYINATDHQTVFVDCYGNALKRANIGGKKTITFENHFYRNDVDYLFISLLSSDNPINYNFYFKYTGTSDGYSVSAIEEKEYNDAFDIYNGNQDLIPWYDRKGNIIAHIYRSNGIFYIYDKNQNFVNSFNYGSFSSYMSANSLFLEFEKKMYIFSYGEYYANVSEKSSKTSYKCACIEIDIVTGKVSYDDDFKYFIEDTDTIKYDNKYQYTCFTYYELNDKGERGDLLMCSIAKKCLSFENSFVYDGFNGKVYKVNRNSVIAQFSGIPYVCTKNERKVLYSNIAYFVSGNKIIAGKVSASYSGKCFICDRNDFVENNKNPSVLYDYISGYRYFGDYITINSDSKTGEYKCTNNGITLDVDSAYFNFVDKGCIVNRGGIYLPNGEMILSSSRSLVGSVGIVLSINNFSIFEVNLNDSTTIYFSIEKTLV